MYSSLVCALFGIQVIVKHCVRNLRNQSWLLVISDALRCCCWLALVTRTIRLLISLYFVLYMAGKSSLIIVFMLNKVEIEIPECLMAYKCITNGVYQLV